MARTTLIFGNGLGRSIDNDYFQLNSGLNYVWNNRNTISEEQKNLVISAIEGLSDEQFPESEEQLDKLQIALIAATFLKSFENQQVEWLNEHSRDLPQAFSKFIHEVAYYFHCSESELPREFIDPLVQFIRATSSHVGVLNYDNLLYDAFVNTYLLNGYRDTLIDGFHAATGFKAEHLDRNEPRRKSWFMHLHGSPLYIGNRKLMREEREHVDANANTHIVLTHVRHKPMIIVNSEILNEYWKRLAKAFDESEKVILFGYSGCDSHLNELVKSKMKAKQVHVIERNNGDSEQQRTIFWQREIPETRIIVHLKENILDFTDWQNL